MTHPPADPQGDPLARILQRQQHLESELHALAAELRSLGAELHALAGATPQGVPPTWPAPSGAPAVAAPAAWGPPAAWAGPAASGQPPAPGLPPEQAAAFGQAPTPRPAAPGNAAPPAGPLFTPGAPATAAPAGPPLWQRPGFVAKALAGGGVAVTLLGVAFVLVLAAQAGLYGPVPRTMTAAVVAVGLIAGAFVLHRRDATNIGGPALFGAGMASAFLFVVAVTAIYAWVPLLVGFALLWLVGLGATYVARLWQSQFLAVAAVLGSLVLTPYLGDSGNAGFAPVGMAVLVAVSMMGLTLVSGIITFGLGWRGLTVARFVPTGTFLLYLAFSSDAGQGRWTALVITALFAGLSVATAILETGGRDRDTLSVLLIASSAVPLLTACNRLPDPAGWIILAVTAAGCLAGGLVAPRLPRPAAAALAAVGTMFLVAALRSFLGWDSSALYLSGLAALYLVVAGRTANRVVGGLGLALGLLALVAVLPVWVDASTSDAAALTGPVDVLALLGLVAVFAAVPPVADALAPRAGLTVLLIAWVGGTLNACTALILLAAQVGGDGGFQAGQVAVSVLVMALAGGFLLLGLRAGRSARSYVALAVAAAAGGVAKLFLWDLATLPGLARAVAFLLVGLLLLGVGTLYAKAYERAQASAAPASRDAQPPAAPPAP